MYRETRVFNNYLFNVMFICFLCRKQAPRLVQASTVVVRCNTAQQFAKGAVDNCTLYTSTANYPILTPSSLIEDEEAGAHRVLHRSVPTSDHSSAGCPCACTVTRLYSMARMLYSQLYNVAVWGCVSSLAGVFV